MDDDNDKWVVRCHKVRAKRGTSLLNCPRIVFPSFLPTSLFYFILNRYMSLEEPLFSFFFSFFYNKNLKTEKRKKTKKIIIKNNVAIAQKWYHACGMCLTANSIDHFTV